jgi:hypothetical protein
MVTNRNIIHSYIIYIDIDIYIYIRYNFCVYNIYIYIIYIYEHIILYIYYLHHFHMRKPSVVPPRPASKVAECDGFRKKTGVAAIGRTTEGFLETCHVGRGQGLLTY